MKKFILLLAAAALLLGLAGAPAHAANANIIINGQTVVNGNDPAPVPPGAIIYDTNGNAVTAPGAPAYSADVQVTKSPTGETVEKGGKATFVAHAAGATGITWRLVSADGVDTVNAAAAAQYFAGVEVWGIGTDSLTIKNIPDSMNGWLVEARFDGQGGPVYSGGARITVVGSSANGTVSDKNPRGRVVTAPVNGTAAGSGTAPVINTQPKGAELTSGRSTTLSVTAGTNDGGTLRYQWYVSTSDDNSAGQAIAGATSSAYTPGELPGTRYYYVGVWSEKDGVKSGTVFSEPAAVVYSGTAASPAPSAAPGPAASPAPSAAPASAGEDGEAEEDPFFITPITDEIFARMEGKSFKEDCTLPREDLRYLHLLHVGFDGETHEGEMVVNVHIAETVLDIFRELYEAGYPIEKIRLVDEYDADDEASMEDNNSSSFNFRFISHTTRISKHGLGAAIDINTLYNPYTKIVDGERIVEPVTAEAYLDRDADFPYKIDHDDLCYKLFTENGFEWGGDWEDRKDYQHFEIPNDVIAEWYPEW